MELQEWLSLNDLDGEIDSKILTLNNKKYFILRPESESDPIINDQFYFILSDLDFDIITDNKVIDVVFYFGSKWYYSPIGEVQFNLLKHIGESLISKQEIDIPYLGIHGKYDFCNGSRDYKDWCKKAKFLGITTLGICEQDTLAGTLAFQMACEAAGIKSILGETITVKEKDSERKYKIKLYCKNEEGWRNLLNINAQIKVFNEGFVDEEYVLNHSEGLVCIIDCSTKLSKNLIILYKSIFDNDLYYQFDPVEWAGSTKEEEHLELMKEYVNKYIDQIPPALVCDSYYLDQDETHIRKLLNTVGKIGFQYQSNDQWFKSINDVVIQCDELFKDEERSGNFINTLIENTTSLAEKSDFKIKLKELHLPEYELTKEEGEQFETPKDLFWDLIQKGLEEKILGKVEDENIYLDRVQEEVRVIEKGGLIDYFLITWDMINWCKTNDILTSIGRGSSAGSLVSYLLGIVKVDPMPYGLLFQRFLSEARLGTSMPDIDNDIASSGRDQVKRYIETRYGIENVTSIGTYGTFKIKAAIKDIGKYQGVDFAKTNYITSFISDDADFTSIFKMAQDSSSLKGFLQSYPQVIENYTLVANQPRTISIHAAGIVITPKTYNGRKMAIYDWLPVKKMDGVLVTEWEGQQLDAAGFLKMDVLGISQLEKFQEIIKLIKQNHDQEISFDNMDLEQKEVYKLFQEGYNEDVFQFGALGLKSYCKDLKPSSINDLIVTVALYRPGPIESGAHKTYVKIKNGVRAPEYDYMLEEVTKDTLGLYIYQESVMKAVHVLGGLTLVEAEDVRKAMGKKDMVKMQKYRQQFIDGAKLNKCSEIEAIVIWNKLESFGSYGFNKSHATAYALIGYFSQWLKYNYPIEFWSVSLQYASQDEIVRRISEMHKISSVKIVPPDINNSIDKFKPDFDTNAIYWSISSIKFIGEKALASLMEERKKNGVFFSFEEFYDRVDKRLLNKRAVLNLILSGCFDVVEKIKNVSERLLIVKKFNDLSSSESPEELCDLNLLAKEHFWILKQKELTGFGYFDFQKLYRANAHKVNSVHYLDSADFQDESKRNKPYCIVGILSEIVERNSAKGPFGICTIDCNDDSIKALIWSKGVWPKNRDLLLNSKNKILMMTGKLEESRMNLGTNDFQTIAESKFEIL